MARISYLIILPLLILVVGCARKMDSTNKFVANFLEENGIQLYKSEIERTKVDFIPSKQNLVYTFWKNSRFISNGNLFLHIFLKDSSELPNHRKQFGFLNVPIGKEDIQQLDSVNFYIIKDLSSHIGIKKLVTGQYVNHKRTWAVEARIDTMGSIKAWDLDYLNEINRSKDNKGLFLMKEGNASFVDQLIQRNTKYLFADSVSNTRYYLSSNNKKIYIIVPEDNFFSLKDFNVRFKDDIQNQKKIVNKDFSQGDSLHLSNNSKLIVLDIPTFTKEIVFMKKENRENKTLFRFHLRLGQNF